jgi:DNA repair exonuclease SbcCD ATPase subunit
MKVIKNRKKKQKALMIVNIRKEYREYYKGKLEEREKRVEEEKEELIHFFEKSLRKQSDTIEKKYRREIEERENKIKELENKFDKNKELFNYIKLREQDLENIMNIIGTKFKGFAELVANGYSSIQSSFNQVEGYGGYNRLHLKNDSKIREELGE